MSDKNLRESTKKVKENQIKRSEIAADIKKQKKKSKALQKQIREEEKIYQREAVELAEYTAQNLEITVEDLVEEEHAGNETFDNNSEPTDDDWDPLGVIKTPRKLIESEEVPSASWSTKVNQFFPQDCELSPRLERRETVTSNIPGNLSPPVLERITEESQ